MIKHLKIIFYWRQGFSIQDEWQRMFLPEIYDQ